MGRHPHPTRRSFVKSGSLAAGALALPPLPRGAATRAIRGRYRTEHVVLVAFAGGVRRKEVLDAPANVPNLMRIASAGVTSARVHAENVGHYGAALSLFTGHVEQLGIRENERGRNPTLFERLRRDAGFGPGDIWLSTTSGAQGRLFAHSTHPDYGADHAANVLDGDGLFNVEFRRVLESLGRPRPDTEHDRAILRRLGAAIDQDAVRLAEGTPRVDAEHLRRVSEFVLDELSGKTAQVTGPGAGDAKAIRVGLNILRTFRPRLLGITLQNHDIAHGSFNGYVDVIRRNDRELGQLWDAIQEDDELRDRTTVIVLPEFGRDTDLNERNGLDHGDNEEQLTEVFLVAAGPDFHRGRELRDDARTIDVCPTVLELLAPELSPRIEGRTIRGLFA